jgi:predicted transcriptional regulator
MSVSELKLEIINKVTSICDKHILEDMIRLLNQESALANTYKLTNGESIAIKEGLQDVAEGNLHTSKSAEKMIKEWLRKN